MTLDDAKPGEPLQIDRISGEGGFRRRLMELGLVPGTIVSLVARAPLGDPLRLRVRGGFLSIRSREARAVVARPVEEPAPVEP